MLFLARGRMPQSYLFLREHERLKLDGKGMNLVLVPLEVISKVGIYLKWLICLRAKEVGIGRVDELGA